MKRPSFALLCAAAAVLLSAGRTPLTPTTPRYPDSARAACLQAAPERFFENQGGDYWLQLGTQGVRIIGRRSWGAAPPMPAGRSWKAFPADQPVCSWYQRITVHHTHGLYTPQSLQTFHQNIEDPKADSAYQFFIDQQGHIFEARPLGRMGSHSERDNGGNLGIALNGNFEKEAPPPAQLKALYALLDALHCPCYGQPIWTHRQRKKLNFPTQTDKWTQCPGNALAEKTSAYARERERAPKTKITP